MSGRARGFVLVALAVGVALALAAGPVLLLLGDDDQGAPAASTPGSQAPAPGSPTPGSGPSAPSPSPAAAPRREGCPTTARRPFEPTTVVVPSLDLRRSVVTPPRDAAGVPGVPPLSAEGKAEFAFDREQGVRAGSPRGNALLNAHTWPDGSALGNRLLAGLDRGDRIVLADGERRVCYRVTEEVEVLASEGLPRYYATDGPHQVAIVVCSGRRLGPGVWERRTVWFARAGG